MFVKSHYNAVSNKSNTDILKFFSEVVANLVLISMQVSVVDMLAENSM